MKIIGVDAFQIFDSRGQPTVEAVVPLAAGTRGGAVYRFVVASASWQLLAGPGSIARPGQSLFTRGGALLVTGADGLYRIKTRGSPDLLGYAPGAFGLAATGDGALLVLQSRQSTLLTTR